MIDLLILIFTYLPAFLVHLVLVSSIFAVLLSFFQPYPASKILKIAGVFLFCVSLYLEGGLAVTREYAQREAEWNNKIVIAEEKAKTANAKIEYIYRDKVKVVKDVQVVVQEKIRDVAFTIDSQCKITKETIDILNESARNVK